MCCVAPSTTKNFKTLRPQHAVFKHLALPTTYPGHFHTFRSQHFAAAQMRQASSDTMPYFMSRKYQRRSWCQAIPSITSDKAARSRKMTQPDWAAWHSPTGCLFVCLSDQGSLISGPTSLHEILHGNTSVCPMCLLAFWRRSIGTRCQSHKEAGGLETFFGLLETHLTAVILTTVSCSILCQAGLILATKGASKN